MDPAQVQRIRSFNRAVTRRVGALSDSFLGRGRPLSEARLLYEIGAHGADIRALRTGLSLDSGYLSRLVRSLEKQGLVESERGAGDARVRRVTLTRKGLRELAELDRRSDEFAHSLLAPLSESQRQRLVAAMSEAERLMQASAVEIRAEAAASTDAQRCLQQYYEEIAERFDTGFDPKRSPVPSDDVTPPKGVFLVARIGGKPVGCGGLRFKEGFGEIKRMWVASSARGLGVGRRILETLEEHARGRDLAVVRLETNKSLKEAQALYRKSGYREIAPYNDEPYAHHWFE
jgi:DNA-binding MarR family transcriptional regulator/ribosomal protein S18 acetylase RimI-like enzyme